MIRFLSKIRAIQQGVRETMAVGEPTQESRLSDLYSTKYDITSPVQFHKKFVRFNMKSPIVSQTMTYVAPSCVLIGDIEVGDCSMLMANVLMRSEYCRSAIGDNVFIGENTYISQSPTEINSDHNGSFMIGDAVGIGPNCILRGCTIEPHAYVGEGCKIYDGAVLETCSILLPGSVVYPEQVIKMDEVWGGDPARFIRVSTEDEQEKKYGWIMYQWEVMGELRTSDPHPQTVQRLFVQQWENTMRTTQDEASVRQHPQYANNLSRILNDAADKRS